MIHCPSTTFLRLAISLIHVIPAAGESSNDLCDTSIYGKPDYTSCITLLYGSPMHRGDGIFNIDDEEHGFLLPYFAGQGSFTINQWRHRITLPEIWANGIYHSHPIRTTSLVQLANLLPPSRMQNRPNSPTSSHRPVHDRQRIMGRDCNKRESAAGLLHVREARNEGTRWRGGSCWR